TAGTERLHAPWTLFLLEDGRLRQLVRRIVLPGEVAWRPDGRWLAFSGSMSDHGDGTWAISLDDGRLVRLSTHHAEWLSWAPNGSAIAMVVDSDGGATPFTNDLLRIDVGEALSED
ncbi:MAG TPA: hypothetical protein VH723_04020, partial [Candidatus Limnocylindrales bacterium]